MTRKINALMVLALIVIAAGWVARPAMAQTAVAPDTFTCSGTLKDADGNPVAGAAVRAFIAANDKAKWMALTPMGEVTTGPDGAFSLSTKREFPPMSLGMLVARRKGLAMTWANFPLGSVNPKIDLVMDKPKSLAGKVVNADGKGVCGATVRLITEVIKPPMGRRWMIGWDPLDWAIRTTSPEGTFAFEDVPADATAEFRIEAPGYASIFTLDPDKAGEGLQCKAGQPDIQIELPAEGRITGVAADPNAAPVAGVRFLVQPENPVRAMESQAVTTDAKGRLAFAGLREGKYLFKMMTPENRPADWVCDPNALAVKAGQTLEHNVALSKGGMLEVLVVTKKDNKPAPGATVLVYRPETPDTQTGTTGPDGIARIRAFPGMWKVGRVGLDRFEIAKRGKPAELTADQVAQLTVTMKPKTRILGTVFGADGKPMPNAEVLLLSTRATIRTDKNGKFNFGARLSERRQGEVGDRWLMVRKMAERLAVAVKVVEGSDEPMSITLTPGVAVTGRVIDAEGVAISGAAIEVTAHGHQWTRHLGVMATTDMTGGYKVVPLAAGLNYRIRPKAEGYGVTDGAAHVPADQTEPVQVAAIALPAAGLSVTGTVLDWSGKPVKDATVWVYSQQQPHLETTSDKDGKLTLQPVIEGGMILSAKAFIDGKIRKGMVHTSGGAQDVKVALKVRPGPTMPATPKRPQRKSLMDQPMGDLGEFNVPLTTGEISDKRVLVLFWNKDIYRCRVWAKELSKQREELAAKNIAIATVYSKPIDPGELAQWLGDNQIDLPVGTVPQDEKEAEKALKSWGVVMTPWLILTDKDHVVRSEALDLAQVEEFIYRFVIPAETGQPAEIPERFRRDPMEN